jgi:hypothetical protein
LILSLALPPAGVFPELPGAGVVGVAGVVPPVDGVAPELPGAGVDGAEGVAGVVTPLDGVFPELPGAEVVPPVLPLEAGVFPELPGVVVTEGVTGVDTTLDLTGVVARVTRVADLRTAAGVGRTGVAAFAELPPPDPPPPDPPPPDEFAVHTATHVNVPEGMVTLVPADCVDPLLQLHPAKVNPDLVNPEPDAREKTAPLAFSVSVGAVPLPPSSVYVTA